MQLGVGVGGSKQSGRGELRRCVQIGAVVLLVQDEIALGFAPGLVLHVVWVATLLEGVNRGAGG